MRSFTLRDDLYKKVFAFCESVHQARANRDRYNNDSGSGRLINELTGKCGEAGVAQLWKKEELIDFEIHKNGKVQYTADLGTNVHVKTCHLKFKNKPQDSWTVDRRDPLCTNPKPTDIIVLVYANQHGNIEVYGHVMATQVIKYWKDCISPVLAHKQAIYKNDIDSLITKV